MKSICNLLLCFSLMLLSSQELCAAVALRLAMPLAGDFRLSVGQGEAIVKGPHRFLKIGGRVGYHLLGLQTSLRIPTDIHRQDQVPIMMWVAPLEALGVATSVHAFVEKDPRVQLGRLSSQALRLFYQ